MANNIILNKDTKNEKMRELLDRRKEIAAGDNEAVSAIMQEIFPEIMYNADFIAAVQLSQPPKKLPNGEQALAMGTSVSFSMLTSSNGEHYLPVFTTLEEFGKWEKCAAKDTVLMNFDHYSSIITSNSKCAGFTINPFSDNLVIPKRFVVEMAEQKQLERNGKINHVLNENTPCEIYTPNPYPMQMSNAITETAKGTGAVNSLWLRGVKLDGKEGYLLVVDFNGDRNAVFSRLGEAAKPFLNHLPLHIVGADSGFGKKAVQNVVPLYTRD